MERIELGRWKYIALEYKSPQKSQDSHRISCYHSEWLWCDSGRVWKGEIKENERKNGKNSIALYMYLIFFIRLVAPRSFLDLV